MRVVVYDYWGISLHNKGRNIEGGKAPTTYPILCERCVISNWIIHTYPC